MTDREALAAVRERFDTPSILVNNAGIDQPPESGARTYRIEDVPLADFRRTVDVNLVGAFNAIQVFGSAMRDAGRGSIVNIGSLYASIAPEPAFYDHMEADPPFLKPAAYGASKAGLLALTRYFARLWGPQDVRVNALSPGGVLGGQDPSSCASTRLVCLWDGWRSRPISPGPCSSSPRMRRATSRVTSFESTEDSRHERPGDEPGENQSRARKVPVSKLLGA